MPRTKQTAKKSNGGVAPRVTLSDLDSGGAAAELQSDDLEAIPLIEDAQNFCILCQDGGKLWCCDSCEQVVCNRCVTIPQEHLSNVSAPDVQFQCVNCHWLTSWWEQTVKPYWGFYHDGYPVLPVPISVNRPLELSIRSRLLSHPTLVIHLRLTGIPAGGPVNMVTEVLAPYFPGGGFQFIDLEFDIATCAKLKKYNNRASHLMSKLSQFQFRNVIVGITDHSDTERGDLFIGKSSKGSYQALVPSECLSGLLSPFRSLLSGAMLFLFAFLFVEGGEFSTVCQAASSCGIVTVTNPTTTLFRIAPRTPVHISTITGDAQERRDGRCERRTGQGRRCSVPLTLVVLGGWFWEDNGKEEKDAKRGHRSGVDDGNRTTMSTGRGTRNPGVPGGADDERERELDGIERDLGGRHVGKFSQVKASNPSPLAQGHAQHDGGRRDSSHISRSPSLSSLFSVLQDIWKMTPVNVRQKQTGPIHLADDDDEQDRDVDVKAGDHTIWCMCSSTSLKGKRMDCRIDTAQR
ncbi:hypothetical protein BKA82DRAFT_25738 [Pisolithus tinctorius]|nr:hypothetical protein BKA82DRAFT_25738 [Pisolithus tinctorius]